VCGGWEILLGVEILLHKQSINSMAILFVGFQVSFHCSCVCVCVYVWSLLMFAIFNQNNVSSSFAIVVTIIDYNCNIKVAVGVDGAWYMISTYWRFT